MSQPILQKDTPRGRGVCTEEPVIFRRNNWQFRVGTPSCVKKTQENLAVRKIIHIFVV